MDAVGYLVPLGTHPSNFLQARTLLLRIKFHGNKTSQSIITPWEAKPYKLTPMLTATSFSLKQISKLCTFQKPGGLQPAKGNRPQKDLCDNV